MQPVEGKTELLGWERNELAYGRLPNGVLQSSLTSVVGCLDSQAKGKESGKKRFARRLNCQLKGASTRMCSGYQYNSHSMPEDHVYHPPLTQQ